MTDDAKDDAVAGRRISETGHGSSAAPHLPEAALDNVGGADLPPVGGRQIVERQQLFQVPFHAGDRARTGGAPLPGPALETPLGFGSALAPIHCRRFPHTRAVPLGLLVGDVPQLMRPTALHGDLRPDPSPRGPQPPRAVGDDQLQASEKPGQRRSVRLFQETGKSPNPAKRDGCCATIPCPNFAFGDACADLR